VCQFFLAQNFTVRVTVRVVRYSEYMYLEGGRPPDMTALGTRLEIPLESK